MPTVEIAGTVLQHRFELEAVAGSGGMALVYRAHDHATGRTVALKLLHASGGDARENQRFEREAQLLAGLHHPAIVRYVAHGHTPSGQPFLAMEWLAGEDLARRLASGPLGLADSLTIAREVAAALAVAHRAGVIHRDIKPSNLFLRDGLVERVTLLDFGVAHLAMSPPMTRTGIAIGTPGYMAPEQARGDRELTASADVFSLGAVLFECLTGRPPFVADHIAALLAKILFEEAPLLGSRRPGLPPALERLLAAMLSKDPAARPQDAAAVAAELTDLLAAVPEPTASAATGERAPATPPEARTPAIRAPLLAGAELQYLSVILAVPEGGPLADQETLTAERARARFLELRQELLPQGYRVECLADGSLVATLAQVGHRTATDQAVQATRCALLIKERWPGALVALVTSRGALRGALPVGDALSRAARLISAPVEAGHGGLRLDDVTAGLVESSYAVQQIVTGCYALIAERSALDETRPLLGKPTPCVGREQELALLDLRLAGCIEDGSARAMLVTAPPGTGKSRLRHEFLRRLRVQRPGTRVLVGRGDPMTAAAPYSLLAGALRQLCELPDGLPPAESRAAIERAVGLRIAAPEADRVARFIGELCGVPFPADSLLRAARQAPELMSAQIQRAFLDLLRAECAAQPVVLVLEDLHWGDRLTVRLCDMALRELGDQPLLILALARPEIRELFPRLWEGRERQELVLGGLRKRACEQLVRGVLGTEVAPAMLARVVEQAGGNALFLEELIRALADDKGEALPETVLAILQARFLRLGTGARRVLYAASVFGETLWRGGVEALLGAPDRDRLGEELAALVDAELIERHHDSRLAGEHEYGFRHALVRDAAYTLLSAEDRVLAHRLAGAWLAEAGERDPLAIAEHFARGHDSARAGQYYVKAVELARSSGDPATAIAHAERGLGCDIPEVDRATLLALIAEEHGWRGDFGRGEYHDLLARCVPGSLPWTSVMATAHAAALLGGEPALAERLGDQLCAATPEPAALANMSFMMMTATVMLCFAGLRARAGRIVRRQDALVDPVADHEPLADAWRCLTHAVFDRDGDAGPGAALLASQRCEAAFAGVHHRRGTLLGKIQVGINLVHLGRFAAAEATLRETFVAGVEFGPYAPFRTAFVIAASIGRGEYEAAAREAGALLAAPGEAHMLAGLGEGLLRRALADALVGLGELARAEHELRAACELLAVTGAERLAALAGLAALELRQGRIADAHARATSVLAEYVARELLAPGRARARRVLVEAALQLGEREQAREQLALACRELHAHADNIADPELRASFLHAVEDHARLLALADEHGVHPA